MQSFLKKASKKLVEDTEAVTEGENEGTAVQQTSMPKSKGHTKSAVTSSKGSAPAAKKGTRKKI